MGYKNYFRSKLYSTIKRKGLSYSRIIQDLSNSLREDDETKTGVCFKKLRIKKKNSNIRQTLQPTLVLLKLIEKGIHLSREIIIKFLDLGINVKCFVRCLSGINWRFFYVDEEDIVRYYDIIFEYLQRKNYDVNARDRLGRTLIFNLVKWNKLEQIKVLVSRGAKLDVEDNYGINLWGVSTKFKTDKLLLQLGLDPNLSTVNEIPYVDERYNKPYLKISKHIENDNFDGVKLFISHGAIVTQEHLAVAIFRGKEQIIKLLLDSGVNPNFCSMYFSNLFSVGVNHATPLIISLMQCQRDMWRRNIYFETNKPITDLLIYGAEIPSIIPERLIKKMKNAEEKLSLLENWPKVVTLRTLCIRVVKRNRVDTEGFPEILLQFPDEFEEKELYFQTLNNY